MYHKLKQSIVIFLVLELIVSCANVVAPTGGNKDSTPPKLIYTYPLNLQTNFYEKSLIFKFDEYFDLENPTKNILISPLINQPLTTKVVGKNLIISFSNNLENNTTYSLLMSNAIKDYNEGNLLNVCKLKFSTGNTIDSSNLLVSVQNTLSNSSSDMTKVVLVKDKEDFLHGKFKYVSRINNGNTVFDNIDKGNYLLYSFVDSNQNSKYDKNEEVGFYDSVVTDKTNLVNIKSFVNQMDSLRFNITSISKFQNNLYTSSPIFNLKCNNKDLLIVEDNNQNYKLFFNGLDSMKNLELYYNNTKKETVTLNFKHKSFDFQILENNTGKNVEKSRYDTMSRSLNAFITGLDRKKIILWKDTVKVNNPQIRYIENKIEFLDLEPNSNYKLKLDSLSVLSNGFYIKKALEHSFQTYSKEDVYNSLNVVFENFNSNKNYLVEISNGTKKEKFKLKNSQLLIPNICGYKMDIKVVIDVNNNGYWDTGDINTNKQPEEMVIITIPLEKNKKEYKVILK